MDERKLSVFVTAANTGSLSRAAAQLGCTQPAATQAMNSLEAELGCRLLERGAGGVRLTEAGAELLPAAVRALTAIDRLHADADAIGSGKTPPVRIACFSSIATTWLPGAITAYRKTHGETTFSVCIETSSIADSLLSRRADLALGDVDWLRAFSCMPLMQDRYFAVVPTRYLDEYPWLGENGVVTREQLFSLPSAMAPMNELERHFDARPDSAVRIACDDDSTLVALVARGLGVAVVPGLSLRDVSVGVRVFELRPPATRTIGVALPHGPSEGARDFARFLTSYGGIEQYALREG